MEQAMCMTEEAGYRRCARCHFLKVLSAFHCSAIGKYQGYCKRCRKAYLQKWRDENRAHWNEYHRDYRRILKRKLGN